MLLVHCFPLALAGGVLCRAIPPKLAHAIVAIESVVVVQRAIGIDIARIARIGSNKAHPSMKTKAFTAFCPSFSTPLSYT